MGKCSKNTQSNEKNILKKQLSLQLFLMANFDRVEGPIDMRVWKGRQTYGINTLPWTAHAYI
jgi:hypothetical protein